MWSPDRQAGETKIIGPAYTVQFVRSTQTQAPKLSHHHIDTVPRGSVILLSAPAGIPNAVYGGLMSHRAQYLGAVGVVIDGNFRDLDEQRSILFPVRSRYPSPLHDIQRLTPRPGFCKRRSHTCILRSC